MYWTDFFKQLDASTSHQKMLFNVHDQQTEKLRTFYGFSVEQLPIAFIIRDDDTLAYTWIGSEQPSTDLVAAQLNKETRTS